MLLDQHGREIPEIAPIRMPGSGRWTRFESSDRADEDVSRDLTPGRVDQIMRTADAGDPEDQARLARSILEKDDAVISAFGVRVRAVLGLDYQIVPGDDSSAAKSAAEAFSDDLDATGSADECDGFPALVSDMLSAIITGYSCHEIIWRPGGRLAGFAPIEARMLDFSDGLTPRLRVSGGIVEMRPEKFLFFSTREHGDPVRGGLIRPLAWIHCFLHLAIKDLLGFSERYGMPFLVAKVSPDSFANELQQMLKLVSSFGPRGGGVVKQGTEIEMVQAASATGDVYFRQIEHFEDVIQRLILGQTASSGDSSGLSKGDAQSSVRQDILEADAKMIEEAVNRKIIIPWTRFNFGPAVAPPKLVYDVTPPEDIESKYRALKEHADAIGVSIRGGFVTPTEADEVVFRKVLGLPELPESARAEWARTRGVRAPITLAQERQPGGAPQTALEALEAIAALRESRSMTRALEQHYRPMAEALEALVDLPDDRFAAELERLSREGAFGPSELLDDQSSGADREAYVRAVSEHAKKLK